MKKMLLFVAVVMMTLQSVNAQSSKNVAKECVLFELFTGVNCPYCPAAANAVAQLMEEGKNIAPVAYHTSAFSTAAYYTNETQARASYYGVNSYPTLKCDGVVTYSGGGNASETNYGVYLSRYNQRVNQPSPFTIEMTCSINAEGQVVAHCKVDQVDECSAANLRLMVALTQCNINVNWQGMHGLHHVCRDMIPSQTGTVFTGPSMTVDLPFEVNWPREDCYLTAWIQSYSTKEVFQAVRMPLDLGFDYDLSLRGVGQYSETNCSGKVAPVLSVKNMGDADINSFDVVALSNGTEVYREAWTGVLPKYEVASCKLSEFDMGDASELSFKLENPNGHADQFDADNSMSVAFQTPKTIDGYLKMQLKTDSHPDETTVEIWNMVTGEMEKSFQFELPKHVYTEEIVLMHASCYRIVVKDSAGDGLEYGGLFSFKDATGSQVFLGSSNSNFTTEMSCELYCDGTLSVDESEAMDCRLYPNPVHGTLYLDLAEGDWQAELFDITGRVVLQRQQVVSGPLSLDGCVGGVYYLRLSNGQRQEVRKVMVY